MQSDDTIYDILGVGFGPSNLALAIALEEESRFLERKPQIRFLDRQARFTWHGGMLLPDSHMQISFLKDLVSLRDPTSPFSFVNYLHKKGRLEAFINKKSFFPTRIEFNDYLRWIAAHFEDRVCYGDDVFAIEPEERAGKVVRLAVRSRDGAGEERVRYARNLVLAAGGKPFIPSVFAAAGRDARICHSASYLDWLAKAALQDRPMARLAIIGRGQSAAEIALDLLRRFSHLRIDLVMRGAALRPADDSPFANEIFNPQFTDFIFNQTCERREEILGEFRNTNYAVVDLALIEQLYDVIYQQRVSGEARLRLLPMHDIGAIGTGEGQTVLTLLDNASGASFKQGYDGVVLATGYEREGSSPLLAGLSDYILAEGVDRAYRVSTRADVLPSIYVQGCSEDTHGLSDTLLSVLAVRSKEIAAALLEGSVAQRQSAA